jgi:F-type H+-transporting ATPase subunit b
MLPRHLTRRSLATLALTLTALPALAADEAAGHHDEAKASPIFAFEPNLAIWSLLVFGILMFILYRYAWAPLLKALDDRESKMRAAYDEAQLAHAEAKKAREEFEARIRETEQQVAALMDEARRDAQHTRNQMIQEANKEATEIKDRALRAIKLAEDEALNKIFTQAGELAALAAGRVLSRELSADEHRRLVSVALEEIPRVKAGKPAKVS